MKSLSSFAEAGKHVVVEVEVELAPLAFILSLKPGAKESSHKYTSAKSGGKILSRCCTQILIDTTKGSKCTIIVTILITVLKNII